MLRQILVWTGLFTLAKALNGRRHEASSPTSKPTAAGQDGKAPQPAASEPRPDEHERSGEAPDWLIDNIAECSKNARAIYLLYLGFLAYCAVTLFGVTDRQIVLDEGVRLPLVNVDVSLRGFFFFAPLAALIVFVYLQLYLQRLRRLKLDLRSDYPDVDSKRLYPWMLNIADCPEPGFLGRLQRFIVGLSLWWVLPIVLFIFLKTHEPLATGLLILAPALGATGAAYFGYKYSEGIRRYAFFPPLLLFLAGVIATIWLYDVRHHSLAGDEQRGQTVDLSFQVLMEEQNEEYDVYWLDLRGAQLQGANLISSVLKRADLEKANLDGATLQNADLREARLDCTHLNDANLFRARLNGASFRYALLASISLFQARLNAADLTGAHLNGANLGNVQLDSAFLIETQLNGADLFNADLNGAYLIKAQLDDADLFKARLNDAWLSSTQPGEFKGKDFIIEGQIDSLSLRSAQLDGALLIGIQLRNANLEKTSFQNAVFLGVGVDGAYLGGTQFRGTR
ncbi:MAG: pentapeptide repeat-containing protein [Rhodothermales bacterium]